MYKSLLYSMKREYVFLTQFWKLHSIQSLKLCHWEPQPCHYKFMSLFYRNIELGFFTDQRIIAYPRGNSRFTRVDTCVQPLVSSHKTSQKICWNVQTAYNLLHLSLRHWEELYNFTILTCIFFQQKKTQRKFSKGLIQNLNHLCSFFYKYRFLF